MLDFSSTAGVYLYGLLAEERIREAARRRTAREARKALRTARKTERVVVVDTPKHLAGVHRM